MLNFKLFAQATPAVSYQIIDIIKAKTFGKKDFVRFAAGGVVIKQAASYFYCDSVSLNDSTKLMEAFGKVHINDQDSVHVYAQYLKYNTLEKTAFLKGNVKLTDGKAVLTTPQLDYDLNTRVGVYAMGGKLVSGRTVVTSNRGTYYGDIKDLAFSQKVIIDDPQYKIKTDSLLFNTASRIAYFMRPTEIRGNGHRKITASSGFYNMTERVAYFEERPIIIDSSTTLIADEVAYDDKRGFGEARGNAILKDSAQGVVIIANNIKTNKNESSFLGTENPLAIVRQEKDSIYIVGDTIYAGRLSDRIAEVEYQKLAQQKQSLQMDSANYKTPSQTLPNADTSQHIQPVSDHATDIQIAEKNNAFREEEAKIRDSLAKQNEKLLQQKEEQLKSIIAKKLPSAILQSKPYKTDSLSASSLLRTPPSTDLQSSIAPAGSGDDKKNRFIEVYRNVRIFTDSLQAVSDSLFYSFQDSVFRLFQSPIVWSSANNQYTQLLGDTIFIFTENKKPKKIDIWKNALMISQPYINPTKTLTKYYNQIAARYMYAYFTDGKIDSLHAQNSAEVVYYGVDDKKKFSNVTRQSSDIVDFYFVNKELQKIIARQDVKGVTYPMRQANHDELKLKNFTLKEAIRPKTKYDLLSPQNVEEVENMPDTTKSEVQEEAK